jgi:hypothetical protein
MWERPVVTLADGAARLTLTFDDVGGVRWTGAPWTLTALGVAIDKVVVFRAGEVVNELPLHEGRRIPVAEMRLPPGVHRLRIEAVYEEEQATVERDLQVVEGAQDVIVPLFLQPVREHWEPVLSVFRKGPGDTDHRLVP